MPDTRTHDLSGKPLYNVACKTCGMGAIANAITAAEKLAWDHVHVKGEHEVYVSGRGIVTQIISLRGVEL